MNKKWAFMVKGSFKNIHNVTLFPRFLDHIYPPEYLSL